MLDEEFYTECKNAILSIDTYEHKLYEFEYAASNLIFVRKKITDCLKLAIEGKNENVYDVNNLNILMKYYNHNRFVYNYTIFNTKLVLFKHRPRANPLAQQDSRK